jgi:glycerol-3-phosphate dehydrogenase
VTLYEQEELMQATSRASTKLLHGGLRYLENGEFRLVYEALRERYWWLNQVPSLTQPLELVLPIYTNSQRSRWLLKLGLWLYDQLAGQYRVGQHRWHHALALSTVATDLKTPNLVGGFTFSDGQMDDYRLGLWVAEQARRVGVQIQEHQRVNRLYLDGRLETAIDMRQYDAIINVAGPWAESLLQKSGITSRYQLDLVRGSHILFNEPIQRGYLLQVPNEPRIFFVLPYQGKTLVGTTEVRQSLEQPIQCSEAEADYLVQAYNAYFVVTTYPDHAN